MTHHLKCWPEFFRQITLGIKSFEVRKNDRDFKVFEVLQLWEYEPGKGYTGKYIRVHVSYVMHGNYEWGVDPEFVIMSIVWKGKKPEIITSPYVPAS